jgi:uncharacterized protein YkwD
MNPSIGRPVLAALFLSSIVACGFGAAPEKENATFKVSDDEQTLVDLTNKARKKEKLPPLTVNETLFKVARAHSANMARQQKMEHVLDDKNPADRIKAAGYKYSYAGENVAAGNGWSLDEVFQCWLDSEPHMKNIMTTEFTEIGIGIARDGQNKYYYTQVFATPRKRK